MSLIKKIVSQVNQSSLWEIYHHSSVVVGTLFEKLPNKKYVIKYRNRKLLRNSCKPGVVSLQCTLKKYDLLKTL